MNNISLIGFMGCGKTAVGRFLSQIAGKMHIDLDQEIEDAAKREIRFIFEQDGEDYFRTLESEQLAHVLQQKNIVLSCGGGIVKRACNRPVLQANSMVVYLEADAFHIMQNTSMGGVSRPLLNVTPDKKNETITRLLLERIPLYESCCHRKVCVSGRSIEDIAYEIYTHYERTQH